MNANVVSSKRPLPVGRIGISTVLALILAAVAWNAYGNISGPKSKDSLATCQTLYKTGSGSGAGAADHPVPTPAPTSTADPVDTCKTALSAASWPFAEFGLLAVLALLLVTYAFSGQHPLLMFESDGGGGLSISKFQFFAWTVVVGYAYAMLYAARLAVTGDPHPITSIPGNVLLAMGFSITTAVAAKAITVNNISTGRITQQAGSPAAVTAASLITSDDVPDLNKIQMLFWTLVGTTIFVIQAHSGVYDAVFCTNAPESHCFPNIDTSLMLLMGLSQASYLGGKLTSVNAPAIVSISPSSVRIADLTAFASGFAMPAPGGPAPAPVAVTISGSNFGDEQAESQVLINDAPLWGGKITKWSDASIIFTLPPSRLDGSAWTPMAVDVNVQVSGAKANPQKLSLT